MNRFKLYLNDTNIEHQKECVKILGLTDTLVTC